MEIWTGFIQSSGISGLIPGDSVFGAADGHIGQDSNYFWDNTAKRLRLGPTTFASRLTVWGDDVTDDIFQFLSTPVAGAKSILCSCNGLSWVGFPGILTDAHINLSGRLYFVVRGDSIHNDITSKVETLAPNKTVPQFVVNLGTTPAAGGDLVSLRNVSEVEGVNIDRTARYLAAPFGTALPASLGTFNIKQSVLGYWLVLENTTHYAQTFINFAGQFTLDFSGGLKHNNASIQKQGTDVASAGTITPGVTGDFFYVTGTGTIDFITITNLQNGRELTLIFAAAATVNHLTAAPPAGTKQIRLAGGIPFVAAKYNNLKLALITDGTTQYWLETGRSLTV